MIYADVIFKEGHPYILRYEIGDNGAKTVLGEEKVKMAFETDPDNYIGAACYLCGHLWSLPKYYEGSIDADHPWECPKCRRNYEKN